MRRMILDGDLRRWEVYATTGKYGFPDPSRILFRCVSDPEVRARAREAGDKSDAEKLVAASSVEELREMLDEAAEID